MYYYDSFLLGKVGISCTSWFNKVTTNYTWAQEKRYRLLFVNPRYWEKKYFEQKEESVRETGRNYPGKVHKVSDVAINQDSKRVAASNVDPRIIFFYIINGLVYHSLENARLSSQAKKNESNGKHKLTDSEQGWLVITTRGLKTKPIRQFLNRSARFYFQLRYADCQLIL